MKIRSFIVVCLAVLLAGCSVAVEQKKIIEDPDPRVRRFVSLRRVQPGLTRAEVKALLGTQVIVGYEMPDSRSAQYKPIVMTNPHRVENLTKGGRAFVVEYYLVGIDASDGAVSDNELSPLVYEGGRLVGWGWDYLNKLK